MDMIQLEKPFAKLNKAKGWFQIGNSGSWISGKNKIYRLDHFKKYEWGMAEYRGRKYLYLRKYWEMGEYAIEADKDYTIWLDNVSDWVRTPKDKRIKSYVYFFDPDSYKSLIDKMTDGDNILEIQALLIDYNVDGRDKLEANILENSGDTFVFRILADKKAKTARFLFFDTVKGRVNPYSFREEFMGNKLAYDLTEENPGLFRSPELFERYFYDTSYKNLMNFLQAPLKFGE